MRIHCAVFSLTIALCVTATLSAQNGNRRIGVNVVTRPAITTPMLVELANHGTLRDVIPQINAVTMQTAERELEAIRRLPFVAAAGPDAERKGIPVQGLTIADFAQGLSTWNLDAINVTDLGFNNRKVPTMGLASMSRSSTPVC